MNITDPATHIIGGIVCILDLMFCFSIIDGTPAYGYTTNSRRKGVCANNEVNTASCICLCVYVCMVRSLCDAREWVAIMSGYASINHTGRQSERNCSSDGRSLEQLTSKIHVHILVHLYQAYLITSIGTYSTGGTYREVRYTSVVQM